VQCDDVDMIDIDYSEDSNISSKLTLFEQPLLNQESFLHEDFMEIENRMECAEEANAPPPQPWTTSGDIDEVQPLPGPSSPFSHTYFANETIRRNNQSMIAQDSLEDGEEEVSLIDANTLAALEEDGFIVSRF